MEFNQNHFFYKDTSKWRLWRGGVKNFLDLGEKSFKKTAKAWKTGVSQLGYSHLVLWPLRSVEEMLAVRAAANFFAHFWTFLKNWIFFWKIGFLVGKDPEEKLQLNPWINVTWYRHMSIFKQGQGIVLTVFELYLA